LYCFPVSVLLSYLFYFSNPTFTSGIFTLSLHDALPICMNDLGFIRVMYLTLTIAENKEGNFQLGRIVSASYFGLISDKKGFNSFSIKYFDIFNKACFKSSFFLLVNVSYTTS